MPAAVVEIWTQAGIVADEVAVGTQAVVVAVVAAVAAVVDGDEIVGGGAVVVASNETDEPDLNGQSPFQDLKSRL